MSRFQGLGEHSVWNLLQGLRRGKCKDKFPKPYCNPLDCLNVRVKPDCLCD